MAGDGYRVGVMGATGAVGTTILALLARARLPGRARWSRYASERSAGKELEWGGGTLTVQPLNDETIQGFDVVLSSPGGAVSSEWSPRFVEAGATVVDNTSFWRMHEDVPLVVAGVNDEAAEDHKGIVANPNCTTMVMMMALAPIHRAVGLERFVVSSYQAVSGTGQKAIEELRAQAQAILAGEEPPAPGGLPAPDRLQRDAPGGDLQGRRRLHDRGAQGDGRDAQDPRRRRGGRHLRHLRPRAGLRRPLRVDQPADPRGPLARGLPRPARRGDRRPGASTTPARGGYPTSIDAAGQDDVLVGRIRRDPSHERTLNLWISGDNLRKGAATNAVQVAEILVERGWLLNQR